VINAMAELAIRKALSGENPAREYRWSEFLEGGRASARAGL
jgi:hypothetical protein